MSAESRLLLGEAAIVSLSEAARLLPGRESENRALLREAGITFKHGALELVCWGDVVALMRQRMAQHHLGRR